MSPPQNEGDIITLIKRKNTYDQKRKNPYDQKRKNTYAQKKKKHI